MNLGTRGSTPANLNLGIGKPRKHRPMPAEPRPGKAVPVDPRHESAAALRFELSCSLHASA